MIFDTHTHIYEDQFANDYQDVIKRAVDNNVKLIMLPSDSISEAKKALDLANQYPFIYCAIGIHPSETEGLDLETTLLEEEKLLLSSPKVKALGEIGLDYHFENSDEVKNRQKIFFIKQIELANKLHFPIIIHSRDAAADTLAIIKEHKPLYGFVFHCFSYSYEVMKEVIALGGYIGLDGPVTYKNAVTPKKVAVKVPLNRLLLETDAPYLAPVPHRGERNEPSFIVNVASMISQLRNMTFDELCFVTYQNGKDFFHV